MVRPIHAFFGFALLAVLVAASPATKPSLTPDQVLRAKGLRLVSHYYLLEDDINLAESMRTMNATRHKVDDYTRHQTAIETDIDSANAKLADLQTQNTAMTDELDRMGKSAWASYNRLVDQVNAVRAQIRNGNKYLTQRQKDLAALDDPSDQYKKAVDQCNASMDAVAHRYDELAADADVTASLAAINKTTSPKVQLGPSVQFKEQRPIVQKLAQSQSEATVPFVTAGGVPQVPVTINDTLKLDMIVDSGAAEVTLTTDTAKQLGLKPSGKEKILHLRAADGKTIDAHVKNLKSIRIGPFTAANVECAIQPPSVKDADNLLGDTFLKRFVYRMDLTAGVLHLSQRPEVADTTPPPEAQPVTQPKVEIISARWGSGGNWFDVTKQVKKLVADGAEFTPGVPLFGDANPGYRQQLQVTVMRDDVKKVLKFPGKKAVNPADIQS